MVELDSRSWECTESRNGRSERKHSACELRAMCGCNGGRMNARATPADIRVWVLRLTALYGCVSLALATCQNASSV